MGLTREPNARAYLAAGNYMLQKSSTRVTKLRVLLFALKYNNKSHYSTKHNHKLEQIRVCNHWHQLLSFASPAPAQFPFAPLVKTHISNF